MVRVCVCNSCGRTIEKDFLYCPWCGMSMTVNNDSDNDKDFFEPVFEKLAEIQNKNRLLRINKIGNSLKELEEDLSLMVLQAELAR